MYKSDKISTERLCWILEQNQEWIKNCDTKTTTILALIGVIFTVLFASDSIAKIIQIWTIFFYSENLKFSLTKLNNVPHPKLPYNLFQQQ